MKSSNHKVVRMIAIFKLLKAILLIFVGIGALRLIHTDLAIVLWEWVKRVGLDPGSRHVGSLLVKAASVTPTRLKELGLGSFVYAALFLTEGIGLWLLKRWAEWFTTIMTSSLLPIELYEIYRHPTPVRLLVLLINLAVVVYLIFLLRRERAQHP